MVLSQQGRDVGETLITADARRVAVSQRYMIEAGRITIDTTRTSIGDRQKAIPNGQRYMAIVLDALYQQLIRIEIDGTYYIVSWIDVGGAQQSQVIPEREFEAIAWNFNRFQPFKMHAYFDPSQRPQCMNDMEAQVQLNPIRVSSEEFRQFKRQERQLVAGAMALSEGAGAQRGVYSPVSPNDEMSDASDEMPIENETLSIDGSDAETDQIDTAEPGTKRTVDMMHMHEQWEKESLPPAHLLEQRRRIMEGIETRSCDGGYEPDRSSELSEVAKRMAMSRMGKILADVASMAKRRLRTGELSTEISPLEQKANEAVEKLEVPIGTSEEDRKVMEFGAKLSAVFEHGGKTETGDLPQADMNSVLKMVHELVAGKEAAEESSDDTDANDSWASVIGKDDDL